MFLYSIMTNIEDLNKKNSISKALNKTIQELPEHSGANYFCYYNNKFYGSTNHNGESPIFLTLRYLRKDDYLIISSEVFIEHVSGGILITTKESKLIWIILVILSFINLKKFYD